MGLRELTGSRLRRKWTKATESTAKFRFELKKLNELQFWLTIADQILGLSNVLSIGRQALNDMTVVEQGLAITVAELFHQFKSLFMDITNSGKAAARDYMDYKTRLEPLQRRRAHKEWTRTEMTGIDSRMNVAANEMNEFIEQCSALLSSLETMDSSADGYPYMPQSNRLSKLGRRAKKHMKACTADIKALYFGFKPMSTLKEE